MSSLADLPALVGFFSYSRVDDERPPGALSLLRECIGKELQMRLGREVRLWQDKEAIPLGTHWEAEITRAIAESAFFIPIVSPSSVNNSFCRRELETFLTREAELGRDDLVFPILYVPVPGLAYNDPRSREGVLKIIQARQYVDWTELRLKAATSEEVTATVARFGRGVTEALRKTLELPEKPRGTVEAEARVRAEPRQPVESGGEGASAERRDEGKGRFAGFADFIPAIGLNDILAMAKGKGRFATPADFILPVLVILIAISISAAGWGLASRIFTVAPSTADPSTYSVLQPDEERALRPNDHFQECTDCPEMVTLPAGSFMMGSTETDEEQFNGEGPQHLAKDDGPQHVVKIARPFAVGKLHVTVDQFAAFVRETGHGADSKCWTFEGGKWDGRAGHSWSKPGFAQQGSHPAVCLSIYDAMAYADWLAQKTGKPYRLLTEAEWEYAARGRTSPGDHPRFWFGDNERYLCRYGNGADQKARDSIDGAKSWAVAPCNDGYAYTSPAGHYLPNAFGLHDMFGNAWQWTADCYHYSYEGAPANGSAWMTESCGRGPVLRGGSWSDLPWGLRSARRLKGINVFNFFGVRVARTLAR